MNFYKSMYYKSEFDHALTYVTIVARRLMDDFGLVDWEFKYNHRKCDLGLCFWPTQNKKGRIELSTYLVKLNNVEQVHDIILHEIAHALVGCGHGHNDVWKAKAKEIGATPSRICHTAKCPSPDYQAICPKCRNVYFRHRQVRNLHRGTYKYCIRCGKTDGRLDFVRCKI